MKNFKYIVIFLIGLPLFAVGQTVLTLEEAIAITLENNFDLRIAKNEVKINEENVSLGNAGMLPRVNGIVTNNNTI
ncbi:MAG: TolC family protein, partial [Flavobacterium sp.]|nr:TolC family protein [Flavobacterium sp.]